MPSRRNDHAQPADAIALLKADHQRVKDLFAQYEAAEHVETKRTDTVGEPPFQFLVV